MCVFDLLLLPSWWPVLPFADIDWCLDVLQFGSRNGAEVVVSAVQGSVVANHQV